MKAETQLMELKRKDYLHWMFCAKLIHVAYHLSFFDYVTLNQSSTNYVNFF